ncbi:MAG: nucleoid-associated protein [Lachnospiraceae bacterium]|nr:nucleoid-associated protein [Lachnospiraceae bacterium]
MKAGDVDILRVYLSTLDAALPCPNITEVKLDEEDSLYGYIAKLCAAAANDNTAKTATYGADDYAAEIVPTDPEGLGGFAETVSEKIYALVRDNAVLMPGSGIFVFFMTGEAEEDEYGVYTAMFKMPFLEMYQCRLDAEGNVSWASCEKLMPKGTTKQCEYMLIDVQNRTVRVSDIEHYIDDCKVNYLAEHVLELRAKKSEKKTVEVMREAAVEVIRECYPKEQVAEKLMDYKREVATHAEQTGSVSVPSIEREVFADNPKAEHAYRERMEHEQVQREPIPVSPKTERALTKKAKLVTDNGIELLVPVEYLKNPDYVEYVQDEDGKITILLKDIHMIDL